MSYGQIQVVAGGIAHIPVLIGILKFVDNKTSKIYNDREEAKEKERAAAAAKAKALAEQKAKELAAAKAKAKAEAEAAKQSANESE